LNNMKLKSTLFNDSPLPFALRYGQVGKIYLKIPFWDMFKSPLVIQIEDIFGLVGIKPMSEWDENMQREAYRETAQKILEQFEIYVK